MGVAFRDTRQRRCVSQGVLRRRLTGASADRMSAVLGGAPGLDSNMGTRCQHHKALTRDLVARNILVANAQVGLKS